MNNNTHPIEIFIASLLLMAEGICWIINEIAGHHARHQAASRLVTITPKTAPPAPATPPHVQPLHSMLNDLTVKQLRVITGISSSRYRKEALVTVAACG